MLLIGVELLRGYILWGMFKLVVGGKLVFCRLFLAINIFFILVRGVEEEIGFWFDIE